MYCILIYNKNKPNCEVNPMKKRVITMDNGVVTSDVMKGKYKKHESN